MSRIAGRRFLFVAGAVAAASIILSGCTQPEPEGEPPLKACPFCAVDIPSAATRCPNCTSQLS